MNNLVYFRGILVGPMIVIVFWTVEIKGCFTYTPNPNRNRTETITATELHRFVFGRPFTYEPNPWTKSKKMPV